MSAIVQHSVPFDIAELRRCLGNFVTGVAVMTTVDKTGTPHGLTANSFTSVSLDPPLILFCIGKTSRALSAFSDCDGFCVNILSEEQKDVAKTFAGKSEEKFASVAWKAGITGAPNVNGSLVTLDCSVSSRFEAGDHLILIGRVEAFSVSSQRPLIYGQGTFISLGVQQEALSLSRGRELLLSCIADYDGKVLLCKSEKSPGTWMLPSVNSSKASGSINDALETVFRDLGASVEISFIYSIYETVGQNAVNMIYRGSILTPPQLNERAALFSKQDVPWNELDPTFEPYSLRRFFEEKSFDEFGVYFRAGDVGHVARLNGELVPFPDDQQALLPGPES